ncbi:hypothetical protein CLM74_09745 [Stenotrophomonas sp. MYb57]|uniref:hypothetical protein n=1 Tax=Stenotrophomonas sp. MYb57 TaxID=1827305 RepID=UPI000CF708F6|nr:hypothetical protein [Stenotrophomonas sp. MYb57]AVJ33033.1 hypothetical protein CLM74_09745 [Stenotrophomonas sp. MYb57]
MESGKLFHQPRQKLKRAEAHIHEIERVIKTYFEGEWCSRELSRDADGKYHLSVVMRGMPDSLNEALGDAVHNLRASLDLLAVEVVRLNGGTSKGVYFPFADAAHNLEEVIRSRKWHLADPEDVDIVRELRPYKGGNQLLRALHDLDIQDKHLSLIENDASLSSGGIRVKVDENGMPIGFDDGDLEFELDPTSNPTASFVFQNDSAFPGEEVTDVLRRLASLVSDILDRFEARHKIPTA